jgi:hypothetical protein
MKIAASNIALNSNHESVEKHQHREHLNVWRDGEEPREIRAAPPGLSLRAVAVGLRAELSSVHISSQAQSLQPVKARLELDEEAELDAMGELKVTLLKLLVEGLTGKKLELTSPGDLEVPEEAADLEAPPPEGEGRPQRVGWGLVYDYYESHYESEKTSFSAEGVIKTRDGREISFQVELNMSREFFTEQSLSIRAGDAQLKDPLVLNFNGNAAELTDTKFNFDLDLDGREDQISFVGPNSGFLALDRNGDNIINDGSELFGPTSGSGFAELAAYDEDGNNWIDESDDIYSRLRIWSKDAEGNDQLVALGQKGVGAIYLGHVSTPFQLNDQNNEQLGQIQSTGLFVEEDGGVGTLQHLDLVV